MSGADRMRRLRARDRRQLSASWVDYGEDVLSTLFHLKLLKDGEDEDPAKLRSALSRFLQSSARSANPYL